MLGQAKTTEEWAAAETRAVALIVLSRFIESDLKRLFDEGLCGACFTVPEYSVIVDVIRKSMLEGRGMIQGIFDASAAVPAWFWTALIYDTNLTGTWTEPIQRYTKDIADRAFSRLFPSLSDIRPLIIRRTILDKARTQLSLNP